MTEIRTYVARAPEVLIVLGLCCLLATSLIGSYVDEDGWLHESFFLIPAGFFLILIGVLAWVVRKLKKPGQL